MANLVQRSLILVQVCNKGLQATVVYDLLTLSATLVMKIDTHPRVQECQLAQALSEQIIVKFDVVERRAGWFEVAFRATAFGFANFFERGGRDSVVVCLLEHFAVAAHGQAEFR